MYTNSFNNHKKICLQKRKAVCTIRIYEFQCYRVLWTFYTALDTLIRIIPKQQIQIMRKFNRANTQPNSPNVPRYWP